MQGILYLVCTKEGGRAGVECDKYVKMHKDHIKPPENVLYALWKWVWVQKNVHGWKNL